MYHQSSIVSSIEFDRDSEYFATAGVTKEIKVYECELQTWYSTAVHIHASMLPSFMYFWFCAWHRSLLLCVVRDVGHEGGMVVGDLGERATATT